MEYFTDDAELDDQIAMLGNLRDALGGDYPFERLDHDALKKRVPEIGPRVVGASYCPMDGHVNPLFLLRALSKAVSLMGGPYGNRVSGCGY